MASRTSGDGSISLKGIPCSDQQFIAIVDTYSDTAKVQRITAHSLRHSYVSLLINLGENSLQIKERLRNEDIETTLGTYGHLYPNINFEVAKKLNEIFSKEVPDCSREMLWSQW